MTIPWVRGVQETGILTVFPGDEFRKSPNWGDALFNRILDEFNRLAAANLFGLRVARSGNAPVANGGGANVLLEISSGTHQFFGTDGKPATGKLDVSPGAVKGITHSLVVGNKKIRAFVFVPANPVIGKGGRSIGNAIKMGLTLHELLHACGLGVEDPSHSSNLVGGDIFMTNSLVQAGSNADGDKFDFINRTEPNPAGQFSLSAATVRSVQDVWLLGQF